MVKIPAKGSDDLALGGVVNSFSAVGQVARGSLFGPETPLERVPDTEVCPYGNDRWMLEPPAERREDMWLYGSPSGWEDVQRPSS